MEDWAGSRAGPAMAVLAIPPPLPSRDNALERWWTASRLPAPNGLGVSGTATARALTRQHTHRHGGGERATGRLLEHPTMQSSMARSALTVTPPPYDWPDAHRRRERHGSSRAQRSLGAAPLRARARTRVLPASGFRLEESPGSPDAGARQRVGGRARRGPVRPGTRRHAALRTRLSQR